MYSDGFEPEGKIARTTRLLQNVPGKTTMTASGPTRSFGPPVLAVMEAVRESAATGRSIDFE